MSNQTLSGPKSFKRIKRNKIKFFIPAASKKSEAEKDVLALHLMLKVQLYNFEKENEHKYSIMELLFSDDTGLALSDYQKAQPQH